MTAILDKIRAEPALALGLVGSLIALLTAFGLDLSADKTAALMGFTSVMLGLVTRSLVTPVTPADPTI